MLSELSDASHPVPLMAPSAAQFAAVMSARGIAGGTRVVLYSAQNVYWARRAAHHHQHRLELRSATLLTALGLFSQPICGFGEGCRPAASKLLPVLQPDLELYPDG